MDGEEVYFGKQNVAAACNIIRVIIIFGHNARNGTVSYSAVVVSNVFNL